MRKYRQWMSVLCTGVMLVTGLAPAGTAKAKEDYKLPFNLKAPVGVGLVKVNEEDPNDPCLSCSYSMDGEMCSFLEKLADPETRDETLDSLKALGYDDLWVEPQIDWAIDDPLGWHHTEYWDYGAINTYGNGYDAEGNLRTGEWDYISVLMNAQLTNTTWIMAHFPIQNTEDNQSWYEQWAGTESVRGVPGVPGLMNQLKDGQYKVFQKDDETTFTIDYTQHTAYVRVRYAVVIDDMDGGEEGNGLRTAVFTDWSETASYGKDGGSWKPYTSETLAAPIVSDLSLKEEDFNGADVGVYTLTVPEELGAGLAKVEAADGSIRVEPELRVKGTEEWKHAYGTISIVNGNMEVDFIYLQEEGKVIPAGTEVEFRCRYRCAQREYWGGPELPEVWSPYSDILTVKTNRAIGKDDSAQEGTTEESGTTEQSSTTEQTGTTEQIGEAPTGTTEQPSTELPAAEQPATEQSGDHTPVIQEQAITVLNTGATVTQVDTFVKALKDDKDPKGSSFGFLFARQKKNTKNSITITWKKPKNAAYYVIYGAKCGKKNHYERIAVVKNTSYIQNGLDEGTYYKYIVSAFDANDKLLGSSNTVHVTTKNGKYANFKKVTTDAAKDKVTLEKKGKTFKLNAKGVSESKKQKVNVHRKICYQTTNKKVATVDKNGKITAKRKGSCEILVYAQNGVYKKIKVTVKK